MTAALIGQVPISAAMNHDQPLDDQCWQQTWLDDFETLSLNNVNTPDGRWTTQYIWPRETIINNEMQFYIDPEEHGETPFSVDRGILSISARPTPKELRDKVKGQPFISGVLTTEKSFSQQYGRFEVVAQVPRGKGLWSAFWLLPSFDSWPEGIAVLPEIDVMEHIGDQPNTFHTTLHTNQTGKLTSHPYDHTVSDDLTEDFHLYSVVWTKERVYWYLDSKPVASHPTPDDYKRPVHFLLNLAVGGNWPGAPDDKTAFPARYRIDKVMAWVENGSCS